MHLTFNPDDIALETIAFEDFLKVDIRIGEVVEVEDFPEARNPSYKIKLDFGNGIGIKKSSAQLTHLYTKENLLGKKLLAVCNFKPRQIGKFMSEVLVLGLSNQEDEIVLYNLDHNVPNGARLH